MPDSSEIDSLMTGSKPSAFSENVQNVTKISEVDPYILVYDAYHGTGGFKDGTYLIEHSRERSYPERKGNAFYINYFRKIVNALVNPIFKRQPERRVENDMYKQFEIDSDRSRRHLNDFMKQIARISKRDGVVFIVMDSPENQPISRAEAMQQRSFPYVYFKKATQCTTYRTDEQGVIEEIVFSERGQPKEKGKEETLWHRRWFPGGWELYEKFEDGTLKDLVASGATRPGMIPVIPFMTADDEDNILLPHPPLYEIARINVAIFNIWSEFREVQRRQGFSILNIPVQGTRPGKLEIGPGAALPFPADARHAPHFISPEVDVQRVYIEGFQRLKEDLFTQASLAGVTGVVEKTGVAKQWDFEATDVELSNLARKLESIEMKIAGLFSLWTGENTMELEVSYPETFGIQDVDSDISRGHSFLDTPDLAPRVRMEAKLGITASMFKDLDPESRDELLEEQRKFDEDLIRQGIADRDKEPEDQDAQE